MKKITGNPKRISIIFTEDILKGFDELIKETGATFSELVRRAALAYLKKQSEINNNK